MMKTCEKFPSRQYCRVLVAKQKNKLLLCNLIEFSIKSQIFGKFDYINFYSKFNDEKNEFTVNFDIVVI